MQIQKSLFIVFTLFTLTVHGDYSEKLRPYYGEALNRSLPGAFFLDLFTVDAWIDVQPTTSGAHYQPGYFSGGTIYHDSINIPLKDWKRMDFANFYNELFHAWWGNVFLKSEKFAKERIELLNDPDLTAKYRRANPSSPALAQEEAYSETVSFLIFQVYRASKGEYEKLYYQPNITVAPVSHSDRPGYTLEAESTFPDEEEYEWLFQKLFHRNAPRKPTLP